MLKARPVRLAQDSTRLCLRVGARATVDAVFLREIALTFLAHFGYFARVVRVRKWHLSAGFVGLSKCGTCPHVFVRTVRALVARRGTARRGIVQGRATARKQLLLRHRVDNTFHCIWVAHAGALFYSPIVVGVAK